MRILIVDDDRDQLAIRQMLLQQSGFETVTASSSDGALTAADAAAPVCAVIDLHIPDEQSGLRLIRDLKKRHPVLRIVVLTGRSRICLRQFPENSLVEDVIEKGGSSAQLIAKLKLLSRDIKHSSAR